MSTDILKRCLCALQQVQAVHPSYDFSSLIEDIDAELKTGMDLYAKIEELLEADLAQHHEWNSLMNAYYELNLAHEALEAKFKAGIRTYVDMDSEGDLIVPYFVPTDTLPNATLILDDEGRNESASE